MKIYRKISIGIAVIFGIAFFSFICYIQPVFNTIGTNHPNTSDFEIFEEYSLTVAKTLDLDAITDEEIYATYEVSQNILIVKVESLTYGYGVISEYPISECDVENEKIEGTIKYEEVTHNHFYFANSVDIECKTKIGAILFLVILNAFASTAFGFGIYLIFYEVIGNIAKTVFWIFKKIKKN